MKDIPGYEGLYAITSCGKVYGYKRKKFLKPKIDKWGYLKVNLYKNSKQKTLYIHRLIALAYIPNPNNYDTVDHIDNDKTHNWLSNLQWLSNSENVAKGNRNRNSLKF